MSRLYDDRPLQNLPVKTINWSKVWNPSQYKSGNGFLLEGILQRRSRFAISDKEKNKFRYIVLHTTISRAHQRKYDPSGTEIEPNFSETKKISTGFLNSSYRVAPKGETDWKCVSEVISLINKDELDALSILSQPMMKEGNNTMISFWIEECSVDKVDIQDGDSIRIRTAGDSPFIENFTKLNSNTEPQMVGNYSGGENIGESWTDKIMQLKLTDSNEEEGGAVGIGMGADEDEWAD